MPPKEPVETKPRDGDEVSEEIHRIEKLKLERKSLEFLNSRPGRLLEWLKGVTGIVAVVGLAVTIWSTNNQLTQLSTSRDEERFDRAISRLGGVNSGERLAGVSGLLQFLSRDNTDQQRATLLFLVNAAVIEKDDTVRAAILDVFTSLDQYHIPQPVLDETLVAARDRNRGLLSVFQSRFRERLLENDKVLFEKGNDEAWMGKLSLAEAAPLNASSATIAALVRRGAYIKDLSKIYCVECDFSSSNRSINLSHVSFDRDYLRGASFHGVNLEEASFDGAYLMQTVFANANLKKAKLTSPPLIDPPVQTILVKKGLWAALGPDFRCADLSDADFTGSVMFGFYWTDIFNTGYRPQFYEANLKGAKMTSFVIFTAIPSAVGSQAKVSDFAPDILDMKFHQSGGYGITVKGWKNIDYKIKTFIVGDDFKFAGPIPKEIWPSIYADLNSLVFAKNWPEAQIPVGLRDFLTVNKALFKGPISPTTCPVEKGR